MQMINYLTKDIYKICQNLIKNNSNFTIEVDKKKDIKILIKTLPSLIGENPISPSVWEMFLISIKFNELSAIIGNTHQEKNYEISYEIGDILLIHFTNLGHTGV